ncbi:hypothetical protein Slin15195_G080760 [Septoria linicola]|uniref:Xylanolytic transcriptional activator regulatory domain-containing protein n=1 Tax=Septoria linicola TaxID=215465 RepID=A0A9Q9AS37_9PEZI|nr:hypothetical protein Slin15195_G080760 [Septoria linicola]
MSMLEGFELTAHLPDATWSQSGPLEGSSPLTSLSSSAGLSINTARRRRHSDSRYIDGHGARQSLQKAFKPSRAPVEASWLRNDVYAFPYSISHAVDEGTGEHGFITQHAYSTIMGQFQQLCTRGGGFWKPFDLPAFPSRAHLERCLLLYLELCAPHIPMLHSTFWRHPVIPWPVLLGCIAIGSSFDQENGAPEATHAFREFLRRSVRWCLEADTALDRSTLVQTCLLNAVTQFNSSSDDNALSAAADLKLALELYQQSYRRQPLEQIDCSQIELLWTTWVQEEAHKRLLWFSWLVDLMLSMSRGHYSLPKLNTRIEHLPCASIRWEADTAWDWNALPVEAQQQTGLVESLHWLYVKHRIPTVLDTTQNTFLTYAVVARTEEVAATVKLALHNWSPTPADGDDEDECESLEPAPQDQWLPANHEYAAWRNSACDVFDSLHFKANSDAAAARGFEGPAILHLHLARLVLLCPYRDFMALVSNLCRQVSITANSISASHLTANILKWLTLDDHKGRLSLVHAGAIFWYIRRYSLAFFYEPFAIYVSTIVLWTYSLYLPQIRNVLLGIKDSRERQHREQQQERSDIAQSRPGSSNESEDDDLIPNTILLDRPCDDEIVQAFVRKGHSMTAEMSGAGDICTPQGRRRLLEESMKLLRRSQYAGYGKAQEYCHLVQKLAQRT